MAQKQGPDTERDEHRWRVLHRLEERIELPLAVLGFVWLALLVVELTQGLSRPLEIAGIVIWVIFVADFLLRLFLAPRALEYLRSNWLTAIALIVPAFRIFRFARAIRMLRAARGLRLVRLVTSLNRGMRALGRSMKRRGAGYAAMLTLLVLFGGAAGMYAFERGEPGGLDTYSHALWWTAMMLTTVGSEYWPTSPEGRILTLLLATYALGVLGYLTAALASFFVGREVRDPTEGDDGLRALAAEVRELRRELRGGGAE